MPPDMRTHTLLRIGAADTLRCDAPAPPWVRDALRRAAWVVVRRAAPRGGLIPVGVRGSARAERFAAWLQACDVVQSLDPPELAARRSWHAHAGRLGVPALAALGVVDETLRRLGLGSCWGPTGSVGFELASGCATATPESDLDIMVRADKPLARAAALALHTELAALPVKVDALLETPYGGVALAEYVRAPGGVLLRTSSGVARVADPWAPGAVAA